MEDILYNIVQASLVITTMECVAFLTQLPLNAAVPCDTDRRYGGKELFSGESTHSSKYAVTERPGLEVSVA